MRALILLVLVAGCSGENVSTTESALSGCGRRHVTRHGSDAGDCRGRPCRTIQRAVDVACEGDTIRVGPGDYRENVVVSKPVTIDGHRNTVVRPAVSAPAPCNDSPLCNGAASNVFLVRAPNVTIRDLTVDGDNPSLTSGVVRGGADLDARNGITQDVSLGRLDGLVVEDVTVKNIYLRGIHASSGGSFRFAGNRVSNVQGDERSIAMFASAATGEMVDNVVQDANDAISANHSRGILFADNRVRRAGSGIHTDNSGEVTLFPDRILNNVIEGCEWGIFVFVPYVAPTVANNRVSGCDVGFAAFGQGAPVRTRFAFNRSIDTDVGFYVTDDQLGYGANDVAVAIEDNVIDGGIQLDTTAGRVVDAQVVCNRVDGVVADTSAGRIEANAITGTFSSTGPIDARGNWWGCPTGPNTAGCATVTGPALVTPFLTRRPSCAP
jgi:hypothetical protein